ncbi:MAG: T9SS C-terminal target domain-containing protein [Bacteroidetes bacterium]|nr:T9SS C-terminal target domain-containing protein [Bacteroidota bacterium]
MIYLYLKFKDMICRFYVIIILVSSVFWCQAQNEITYKEFYQKTKLSAVIDFSKDEPDYSPKLQLLKSANPAPLTELSVNKKILDEQRKQRYIINKKAVEAMYKSGVPQPQVVKGFKGNTTSGTPNDNDMAISNSNTIVSVLNQAVGVFNDTGKWAFNRSLSAIAKGINNLNRTFDPRVIYDPENDRFILVFLQGAYSGDTRVIVGFTQTNDPTKNWNFYAIPGNIFGDSSWSDYPIIAINKNDLFITVNRLKDNTYWKNGFMESIIWQVDKQAGYKGDSLPQKAYTNIAFGGKSIWSICPARQGNDMQNGWMHFVSVRPSDLQNDTVFLHEITGSLKSGNAKLTTKILKTNLSYGLQPNAYMSNGKKLQTNDARILTALYQNNALYYGSNTIDTNTFSPAIYVGHIDFLNQINPKITGRIISSDTLDFGYPSIAYAGGGLGDKSALITFSHTSDKTFPGTSVAYIDRNLNVSIPTRVKAGESIIQLLFDSVERWGDYTGIQQKYNELGVCWLVGSYGSNNTNSTWLAKVKSTDPSLLVNDNPKTISNLMVYPVPSAEIMNVQFEMKQSLMVDFTLLDMQGREIPLLHDKAKAGINNFSFDASDLSNGLYVLYVKQNENILFSKKIIVAH